MRTVLAQPAADPHDRAVRWRQLVELAARAGADGSRDLLDKAIAEIRDQAGTIDERVRTAAALAIASHPLPAGLVAMFASDGLAVAAPVLASARLTASEWKHVQASASRECQAFIAALRSDDRPPAAIAHAHDEQHGHLPHAGAGPAAPIPSISEVVARIERIRHARDEDEVEAPAVAGDGAAEDPPRLFRWECNDSGEIEWVDGAPRGAVVGQSIAQRGIQGGVDRTVERAFGARSPFQDGFLELPSHGLVGGIWKISGIPAFERTSGRFTGYSGLAERPGRGAGLAEAPNSLRELVHEIRTPLNAIIGFAEMIAGEYLGPAEDRLRERANDIIGQARLLQSAVEDLDLAARRPATKRSATRFNLGELVESLVGPLRERAAGRGVDLEASRTTSDLAIAADRELAGRLIERLCAALIDRAAEGERLRLSVDRAGIHCVVSVSRPAGLHGWSDVQLFGGAEAEIGDALCLRLARGLAQAAGVGLVSTDHTLELRFPRA